MLTTGCCFFQIRGPKGGLMAGGTPESQLGPLQVRLSQPSRVILLEAETLTEANSGFLS